MAYRETLKSTRALGVFLHPNVVERIQGALDSGQKVEMEHTSFSDPGPDESRVMIDDQLVWVIPGY